MADDTDDVPGDADLDALVSRVNVVLATDAAEAMRRLQERSGLKKVDIVNRALNVYEFVDQQTRGGGAVLVRDPNGETTQIRFF